MNQVFRAVSAALAAAAFLVAAGPAAPVRADDNEPRPADVHRVVMLAPGGPLLIGIRLETGTQSVRAARDASSSELFRRLDGDKSERLEMAEQAYLPRFRRSGSAPAAGLETFLADGAMTEEGFKKYIDDQLGPLFRVETTAPRLDQSVRLDLLDRDRDGVLSVEDVVHASDVLSRYDLDDDESLSVSELQPFPQSVRQAQQQQAAQEGRGSRVFLVEPGRGSDALLATMTSVYGSEGGLAVERVGLPGHATEFDRNSDGKVDSGEMHEWAQSGPVDIDLLVAWRNVNSRLGPVVTIQTPTSKRVRPKRAISKSRWEGLLDDVPLTLSATENRIAAASDSIKFFVVEARRLDRDQNGYLDEAEFSSLGTSSPYTAVDLNHDGMVKFDEIRDYFSAITQLSQTRVIMTFADAAESLFQIMDADRSNRLSPRELLTLRDRLVPMDRNQNGRFDGDDFVSNFSLSLAFAKPEGMEFTPSAIQAAMNTTGGVRRTIRTGPLWYQRMDRNRDHDISWREFLGPRAKFDEVDTDHDGLISREEAEAADAKAKAESTTAPAADAAAP